MSRSNIPQVQLRIGNCDLSEQTDPSIRKSLRPAQLTREIYE